MMTYTHGNRLGDYTSRREIDVAIGILMGIRRSSAQAALEILVDATRVSGVGLGAVSRALLGVVSGDAAPNTDGDAVAHWNALLASPSVTTAERLRWRGR